MIVVVCPGQGSQTPGFLTPWLEAPGAPEPIASYAEQAGVDLVAAGTEWDAVAIRDTQVAQPLIVAASVLAWSALTDRLEAADAPRPTAVAGHSVGEISALIAAGVLTANEGMRLVGVRGRSMADAAALTPSGMSAVLGGDEAAVRARLAELGLTAANVNGGGQIVAAGDLASLAALAGDPVRGSRVVPLEVAGAFHTDFMLPAVEPLRFEADRLSPADPAMTLWTNRDGSVVASGDKALDLLVGQVANPVRWDLCMDAFAENGVTGIIELAPAGTLTGLAKRALRGVPSVAVKTPDDLDAAVELIAGGK